MGLSFLLGGRITHCTASISPSVLLSCLPLTREFWGVLGYLYNTDFNEHRQTHTGSNIQHNVRWVNATWLDMRLKVPDADSNNDVTMTQTTTFWAFFRSHVIIFDASTTYVKLLIQVAIAHNTDESTPIRTRSRCYYTLSSLRRRADAGQSLQQSNEQMTAGSGSQRQHLSWYVYSTTATARARARDTVKRRCDEYTTVRGFVTGDSTVLLTTELSSWPKTKCVRLCSWRHPNPTLTFFVHCLWRVTLTSTLSLVIDWNLIPRAVILCLRHCMCVVDSPPYGRVHVGHRDMLHWWSICTAGMKNTCTNINNSDCNSRKYEWSWISDIPSGRSESTRINPLRLTPNIWLSEQTRGAICCSREVVL